MAELATIARPYAEALFQACRDDLAATQDWLGTLSGLAASPDLIQLAGNPKVEPGQLYDLMAGAVEGGLPERGANFLRALIENRRLPVLPEVAHQFGALADAASGVTEAVVYTAFELSDADLADLKGALERRFGRKLSLRQELDRELIGGVKVVAGDEVLDTSVRARLQQMRTTLTS